MEAINKVDLFSRELWVVSTAHAKDEAISQVPNSQAPNGHGDATQKSRPSPRESITNLSLEVSSLGKVSRVMEMVRSSSLGQLTRMEALFVSSMDER